MGETVITSPHAVKVSDVQLGNQGRKRGPVDVAVWAGALRRGGRQAER